MKKTNVMHDDVQKIKEKLEETSDAISQTARDLKEEAKIKVHDLENKIINYIQEKPFKSLGIAILSGVVLALLLKR